MDFALIEKLMRMLETSSLGELDVTEGGMRIRLAKQRGALNATAPEQQAVTEGEIPATSGLAVIRAGMAGTFYRAPAPGAAPFVEVGTVIHEGDPLAIVEAMKMHNPVEADCNGTIRSIQVEDGGSVEPGAVLFEIERQ